MHVTKTSHEAFSRIEHDIRERITTMRKRAAEDRQQLSNELIGNGRSYGFSTQVRPRLTQIDDYIENQMAYLRELDAFREILTVLALPPFAILPAALWDKLTVDFGTYRFDNFDREGRVNATPLGAINRMRINSMRDESLLQALWPNKHDNIVNGIRIHPYFPQAPLSFQEKLARLRMFHEWNRFPLCVVAAPEAITIVRDEVISAQQEYDLPKPTLPLPSQDPILYTRNKHATCPMVALLDFFGEFPQEERLVQYAKECLENMGKR